LLSDHGTVSSVHPIISQHPRQLQYPAKMKMDFEVVPINSRKKQIRNIQFQRIRQRCPCVQLPMIELYMYGVPQTMIIANKSPTDSSPVRMHIRQCSSVFVSVLCFACLCLLVFVLACACACLLAFPCFPLLSSVHFITHTHMQSWLWSFVCCCLAVSPPLKGDFAVQVLSKSLFNVVQFLSL
jgi:hypothetical protein